MSFMERLRKSADLGVEGVGGGILGEVGLSLLVSIFGTTGSNIDGYIYDNWCYFVTGKSLTNIMKKLENP